MLRKLAGFGVIYDTDPQRVSSYALFDMQNKLNANPPPGMAAHQKFACMSQLSLARDLAQV